jgi:hypothetical protein
VDAEITGAIYSYPVETVPRDGSGTRPLIAADPFAPPCLANTKARTTQNPLIFVEDLGGKKKRYTLIEDKIKK